MFDDLGFFCRLRTGFTLFWSTVKVVILRLISIAMGRFLKLLPGTS